MNNQQWKQLNSEYIFQEPWLTVRKDSYKLPNGAIIPDYYILEYPDWVNTIAITKDNKFIMVRQYRPGLQYLGYELCAGVVDKEDTSFLDAAQRELIEETGYGAGNWSKLMDISPNSGTHTNTVHCFLATDLELIDTPHLDNTEYLTVHLLSPEELITALKNNGIKQATQTTPLWRYIAENKLLQQGNSLV